MKPRLIMRKREMIVNLFGRSHGVCRALPLLLPPPLLLPLPLLLPMPPLLPLSLPLPPPSLLQVPLPFSTAVWLLVALGWQLVQNPWMAAWFRVAGAFAACVSANIVTLSATLATIQAGLHGQPFGSSLLVLLPIGLHGAAWAATCSESMDGRLAPHCYC